ncbi:MAG: hypothetical protein LBN40_05585 [Oscillospiraceae bacterium]|jgi:hypothetical protein|nr:hypothetical protein [Oscillospiraceae bacterium]
MKLKSIVVATVAAGLLSMSAFAADVATATENNAERVVKGIADGSSSIASDTAGHNADGIYEAEGALEIEAPFDNDEVVSEESDLSDINDLYDDETSTSRTATPFNATNNGNDAVVGTASVTSTANPSTGDDVFGASVMAAAAITAMALMSRRRFK